MSDEAVVIKVVGVDKNAIEMSSGKQSLWVIPFRLSQIPNPDWERKFYEVQQKDKVTPKRKAQLVADLIKVEVTEIDDLQKVLEAVQAGVTETNNLCEVDYQTKLRIRRELEVLQIKQSEVTTKLKNDAEKLSF